MGSLSPAPSPYHLSVHRILRMPPRKKPAPPTEKPPAPPAPTRPRRDSQPRTASGKRASTQLLASAALNAQEGLRERTEAGHIAAGRTPPSQESAARRS